MAEITLGIPVNTGDTWLRGESLDLLAVRSDRTRRVVALSYEGGHFSCEAASVTSASPDMPYVVPEELAGTLPYLRSQTTNVGIPGGPRSVEPEFLPEHYVVDGLWLVFVQNESQAAYSDVPVTPGDAYYRFRHILGEHALRFMTEHNPAHLRYLDENQVRIEHIAHELSNENRKRAANVSEKVRERIGRFWVRNEALRLMPFGTELQDRAWRAERDSLTDLLTPFCELCEGAGLSHRLVRHHPAEAWARWQKAGAPFYSDREFHANVIPNTGIITPLVTETNLVNFRHAVDHNSQGYPDDDFLNPSIDVRPVHRMIPATPVMPTFRANFMEKLQLACFWRQEWDAFKALPVEGSRYSVIRRSYRSYIVMQLLVGLQDRYIEDANLAVFLEINKNVSHGYAYYVGRAFLSNRHQDDNLWAGESARGFSRAILNDDGEILFASMPGVLWLQGENARSTEWITERRDEVFALVDAILGDTTPGRQP